MKEAGLSSIVNQLNTLLLTANTLICESGLMENAGRKYGFKLYKEPDGNLKSGFHYVARFKHPEDGWKSKIIKSTGTDNETEANSFAIENRDAVIREYKERKESRQHRKKNDAKAFHKMLLEYYQTDSVYLKDDAVNNKRPVVKTERARFIGFFNGYLIPYLQGQGINGIQEVSKSVYSGLKIYLQDKGLSTKTINNNLTAFVRVLQYHERNGLIDKLPYSTGNALLRITKEDRAKTNANKPALLPTEMLPGIFTTTLYGKKNRDEPFFSYLLAMLGLTCGLRDSEIGRIKREDIKHIKSENAHYVKVFNNKTDFHNNNETDEYRKMPLHPFIVKMLKSYIVGTKKEKGDYLFGNPKMNEDTKQIDGQLNMVRYRKAIVEFYKRILIKERFQETRDIGKAFQFDDKELLKEMGKKRIRFYSLRHTFQTLLATKYKDQGVLYDYFMGHKPQQTMLANYLHINQVGEGTFWNEYGKLLVDFQGQFIQADNRELHTALKNHLIDEAEKGNLDIGVDVIGQADAIVDVMMPILPTPGAKKYETAADDDFFDSV